MVPNLQSWIKQKISVAKFKLTVKAKNMKRQRFAKRQRYAFPERGLGETVEVRDARACTLSPVRI